MRLSVDFLCFLATFALQVCQSSSVIRNELTDRCLHLRSSETRIRRDSRKLPVYGRGCSWDIPEQNLRSHPDEHLEIVNAFSLNYSAYQNQLRFNIRRVSSNSSSPTCLATRIVGDEPVLTEHCSQSLFAIDLLPQKEGSSSRTSFKIRNGGGNCLTVKPGSETLSFKECSPRHGQFQVWSVCRPNSKCDVDFKWSPRGILFHKNGTNGSESGSEVMEQPRSNLSQIAPEKSGQCAPPTYYGVVNELLYTVQNSLRIYAGAEDFLASSLEALYPQELLKEAGQVARDLCRKHQLQCDLCRLSGDWSNGAGLVQWMTQCNQGESQTKFLSEDVLQVILNLFPIQQHRLRGLPVEAEQKAKVAISALKTYLKKLETQVEPEPTGTPTPSAHPAHEGHYNVPILLDIDIRLKHSNGKSNSSVHP